MSLAFLSGSSVGSNSNSAASSFSLTLPPGWSNGTFAFYVAWQETTTAASFSGPAGWTVTATTSIATSPGVQAVCIYRQLQTGDTNPTITSTQSAKWNWAGGGYTPDSGDAVSIDVEATVASFTSGVTTFTPNSAVASGSGELSIVAAACVAAAVGSTALALTSPSGWTAEGSNSLPGSGSLNAGQAKCSYHTGQSGTVSPGSFTSAASAIGVVFHFLIKETATESGSLSITLPAPSLTLAGTVSGGAGAEAWALTQESASQGETESGTTVHGTLPAASSGTATRPHLVVAYLAADVNLTSWSAGSGWTFPASMHEFYGNNCTAIGYYIDSGTHVGTSTTFTASASGGLTVFMAEYDPGFSGAIISLVNEAKATAGAGSSSLANSVTGASLHDLAVVNVQELFEISSSFSQNWYDATYSGWNSSLKGYDANPKMMAYGHAWTSTELATLPGSCIQMPLYDSKTAQGSPSTAAASTTVIDVENGDLTSVSDIASWINARNAQTGGYAANRPTVYLNVNGAYYVGATNDVITPLYSTYNLLPGRDYDLWVAHFTEVQPTAPQTTTVGGHTVAWVATQWTDYNLAPSPYPSGSYNVNTAWDQTWWQAFAPSVTWTPPSGFTTVGSEGNPDNVAHQHASHKLSVAAGTVSATASTGVVSESSHGWSGEMAVFTAQGAVSGESGSFSITLPVPALSLAGTTPGPVTLTPSIVNAWPVTATDDYGHQYTEVANTTGNGLVALLGLGSNSQGTLPRFAVADDAHNFWIYCGTREDVTSTRNRRVDVWVAPNASAASVVSVAESWFTNGAAGVILEVENFPEYAEIDFVALAGGYGTSAALSATALNNDVVFGALLISGAGSTVSVTPPTSPFTNLTTVTTGSASADQTSQVLYPAWASVSAGPVGPEWSWSGNQHYESIIVGFNVLPAAPGPANANWPALKVEAAFGFQPGDVGAMPVWTDITTRAQDAEGQSVLKASRGRDYELTQPEAGTLDLTLDNHDGAFNPLNTASPFYPDVLPEVPVRASAFWQGKQFPVAFGYADKWPQNFRDPQWGQTNFESSDTLGAASNITLPSAYQGDVLIDQPYAFFPLGEQYSPANGEPFNNASRTNIIPAYGIDNISRSNGQLLSTGQNLNMAGDSGTGVGLASGGITQVSGGPGVLYYDPNMPQLAEGLTLEFWAAVPHVSSALANVSICALEGPPSNYARNLASYVGTGDGTRLNVIVENDSTIHQTIVTLTDFAGANGLIPEFTHPTDGNLHHYVVTVSLSGSTWTVSLYLDGGAFSNTVTGSTVGTSAEIDKLCMGPLSMNGGVRPTVPYTIGFGAIYPYVLDATRIAAHYNTGSTAMSGDSARERLARLNAWGGQGLPIAATAGSPSPLIGNADQIQGQALADALNDIATADGGMAYCDGQGNLWYVSRSWFYNRVPRWTFGDNVVPGFMSDATALSSCYSIDPVTTAAVFNQPNAFISGGNPTTDPRPSWAPNAIPLANYTAYAQLQADVTNTTVISGGNTYTPRAISSWCEWVRYDIESWASTPSPESADPQTYLQDFISLAHANGFKVIVTPARDLASTDTVHPQLSGETDDAWYIRTNIPAACAGAEILSVQTQADQGSPQEFWWFYSQARSLVKAVSPATEVWSGLSTTYGNGQGMYSAAQTAGIADGFWLNILTDYTDSIAFMQLWLAQPLQAPYINADFDFSNTFLYNQTASARTISSSTQTFASPGASGQFASQKYNQYGANAIEADQDSEQQYMPRTVLSQPIETTSDQDAYDRASWSLVKYKQPQLRANQILLDCAANPSIFGIALGVEQGDVVSVLRRPVGAVPYVLLCIVQKVEHDIGPSKWNTTLTLSPYYPEGNVLQLDTAPFDNPANGVLGW